MTATVTGNEGTVAYQWLADGKDIEGATKSTLKITKDFLGKKISVEVTDGDDVAVSDETKAVTEDNTASVTVSDLNGLQTNGTGIVGDTLHLSYGSEMGVPELITWYYNDTVAKSERADTGSAQGLSGMLQLATGGSILKDGKYYAVITNKDGKTYTSNTLELVFDETAAVVSSFAVADDYAESAHIDYDKDNNKAFASVTLNKMYAGKFYIYKSDVQKYSTTTAVDPAGKQVVLNAAGTKWVDKNNSDWVEVSTYDKLTAKNAYDECITKGKAGIYFVAANGEVTLMWDATTDIATNTLRRGSSYKLAFDQAALEADDITATPSDKVKATDPVTVPYVKAPAKINLVTAANGQQAVVNILDENDALLAWMGASGGTADTALGFEYITIYGNDSAKEDGKERDQTDGNIAEGVFKSAALTKNKTIYWAEAKTVAGVFAAESATLKSDYKTKNIQIAGDIVLKEDGTTASSAVISLKDVAGPAKIYVYENTEATAAGGFNPDYSSSYRGYAEVKVGQGEATVANVFTKDDIGKTFYAVLVPDDEAAYARKVSTVNAKNTVTGDDQIMILKQVPTTIAYSTTKANEGLGTATAANGQVVTLTNLPVDIKDQFGQDLVAGKYGAVTAKKATVTPIDAGGTIAENGDAVWNLTAAGVLNVVITSTKGVNKGDGWKVAMLGGTLEVKALAEVVSTQTGTAYYGVKLGSDVLVSTTFKLGAAVNAATETDFANALSSADTTTINVTGDFTTSADYTIAATQTVNITKDHTLTIGANKKITNNGTLTVANDTDATATALAGAGDLYQYGTFTFDASQANSDISMTGKIYTKTQANAEAVAQDANASGAYTVVIESDFTADGAETFTKAIKVASGKKLDMTGQNLTTVAADLTGAALILTTGTWAINDNVNLTGATITQSGTQGAYTIADGKKLTMSDATTISGIKFTVSATANHTAVFANGAADLTVKYAAAAAATTDIPTTSTAWPAAAKEYTGQTITITNTSGTWTFLGTHA